MSAHSLKSRRRHVAPTTFTRELFEVGHVTFELIDHPEHGRTFALIAGEAIHAADRRPLFTGHLSGDFAAQLRLLADRVEEIMG